MKYFTILLASFVLLQYGATEQAAIASETNPQKLTLPQAISIALQRNYEVVAAKNNLTAQRSATRTAYGNFMPNLSIGASTSQNTRTGPIIIGGEVVGTQTGTQSSYSTGLSSNITLFDGFSNFANLNRSRHSQTASEYTLENTERNVVYRVYTLYYNIFRTEQLLKVRQEDLRRQVAQLERITEMNRVGIVPIVDVRRQEFTVGNAELQVIQAERNHENAKADLIFYLGLNPLVAYDFDPAGVPREIQKDELTRYMQRYSDLQRLSQQTLNTRPDLEAQKHRVYAAESGVTIARSTLWPSISLSGSYGMGATDISLLSDNRSHGFSLNIGIPLFTRFNRSNSIQQAKIQLHNAETQLAQLENNTLLELKRALHELEAAAKRIEVTEKNIIAAREEQRLAEERYNLGAGTLLDLIIANANFSSAQNDNIDAIFTFYIAVNQLRLLTGEELY